MLSDKTFSHILEKFGNPTVDLFTSRAKKKLAKYKFWKPDPNSIRIDEFLVTWNFHFNYCFPLFSLIWRVINRFCNQSDHTILIAPLWPTQSVFPVTVKATSLFQELTTNTLCTPKLNLVAFH